MKPVDNIEDFIKENGGEIKSRLRDKGLDPEDDFQDYCIMLWQRGSLTWYNKEVAEFSTFIGTSLGRFIASRLEKKSKEIIHSEDLEENAYRYPVHTNWNSIFSWWDQCEEFKRECLKEEFTELRVYDGGIFILTPYILITLLIHFNGDWKPLAKELGMSQYAVAEWKKRLRKILGGSDIALSIGLKEEVILNAATIELVE